MIIERIINLEIKSAYQEDLQQTLNSIVSQHQLQLTQLEEKYNFLNERLKSLSSLVGDAVAGSSDDDVPPHY